MKLGIFILLILYLTTNCFAIQKNVNSQKWTIFAFDRTDNTAKTGDLGQITGSIWKDGAEDVIADTNPTELAHGYYEFDLDQAETNGDYLVMDAVSSTGNIQVVGCPMGVWTTAPYFSALSIDASGRVDIAKWIGTAVTLSSGNKPDVNIDEISDDTTAPGNLELRFDGTGYVGGTIVSQADLTEIGGVAQSATDLKDFADNGFDPTSDGVLLQDGTGTGQIDLDSGTVLLRSATETQIDNIETDTAAMDEAGEWDTLNATLDGKLDTIVTAVGNIETDTSAYDTDGEYASAIWDALMSSYSNEASMGGELQQLDPNVTFILADTAAWDTANEARTLLTGGTTALSILTTSDNIGINLGDVSNPTTVINLSGTTIKTATDVEADTDDIGVAGIGLTAINLPNQTMDIIGNITGNLSGSVGTLTGGVDLVKIHGSSITETTSGRFATNWNTFFDNADSDTAKTLDDIGGAAGLEVDVTKIHGTAINESTTGRIAANFSTFWDNADAATAKVVDNVGASAAGGGSPLVITAGNLGDYKEGTTAYFIWRTVDQGGAAVNPSTTGTIKIYKNDSDVEVTVDTGITDTRGFDSLTGIHLCIIDFSANSFYNKGQDYSVVLTGTIIDSQTVTAVIATFSIEKRWTESFWQYGR